MSKTKRTGAASVINPDARWMHYAIIVAVAVTLLAAIAISWNGLMYVGKQQQLPDTLTWLTPVMIDVPLVALTFARGALTKRGVRTRGILTGILALTIYSSAANLAHSLAVTGLPTAGVDGVNVVLGAATNAAAPWLILGMTETLWRVATRKAQPAKARKPATPTMDVPVDGSPGVGHVPTYVTSRTPVASRVEVPA